MDGVCFQVQFMCEIDAQKRAWLAEICPGKLPVLFGDAAVLRQQYAINYKSEFETREPVPDVMVLMAGFSCRSVSGLNPSADRYKKCVQEDEGSTGTTANHVLRYVYLHHPQLTILENVKSILGPNATALQANLEHMGYNVKVVEVSPHRTALPQQRRRVYFVAADEHISSSATMQRVAELVASLEAQPSPLPLDRFLLRSTHPLVVEELHRLEEKRHTADLVAVKRKKKVQGNEPELGGQEHKKHCGSAKWVGKQLSMASKSCSTVMTDSSWGFGDTSEIKESAWFQVLTQREQNTLLTLAGCVRAEVRSGAVLDLSQEVDRKTMNTDARHTNCVTPDGQLWHLERSRLLLGVEKMALQAVLPPGPAVEGLPNKLACDLAGNAFNGQDLVKTFLALLVALGEHSSY